jgi:2-keto-3-deoxy-galactonokinase
MANTTKSPLTGGLMIIIMPGRGGNWVKTQYTQNTTQQLIKLREETTNMWAHSALPDEIEYRRQIDGQMKQIAVLKHPLEKRMTYWLNEHFLSIIGAHQLRPERCSWSFQHDQF